MKAILVIDEMPKICDECPYCGFSMIEEKKRVCLFANSYIFYGFDVESGRWKCCPLKPMPNKQATNLAIGIDLVDGFKDGWNYGWNACIDEIIGDNNE